MERLHIAQSLGIAALITALSQAGEVKLDGRAFTIPEGFTIERIAGPPLVDRPITAAFDDAGTALCRRLVRLQRQREETARGKAPPDRPAGRSATATENSTRRPSSPTR